MAGFIKLQRQIIDWEWYTDIKTKSLFIHCLIQANHKDNKWRGIVVKAGSFITSYEKLAVETGLSLREVRTSIKRLKSTNEITHETTSQYSVISIVKWGDYQGYDKTSDTPNDTQNDTQDDNQTTNERQSNDNQTTTNKNEKNDKNDKNNNTKAKSKRFVPPTIEEVEAYIKEKNYSIDANRFIDYYTSKGWVVGKSKMKDWKASIRTWVTNQKQYQPTQHNRRVEMVTDYGNSGKKLSENEREEIINSFKNIGKEGPTLTAKELEDLEQSLKEIK